MFRTFGIRSNSSHFHFFSFYIYLFSSMHVHKKKTGEKQTRRSERKMFMVRFIIWSVFGNHQHYPVTFMNKTFRLWLLPHCTYTSIFCRKVNLIDGHWYIKWGKVREREKKKSESWTNLPLDFIFVLKIKVLVLFIYFIKTKTKPKDINKTAANVCVTQMPIRYNYECLCCLGNLLNFPII